MGIHNYDLMYQTAKENVQKAAFSERNKELIIRFTVRDGIGRETKRARRSEE